MSFKGEKERKKEIQLLLEGKGMLEAALAIQHHIQMDMIESRKSIGMELIVLIQGAEVYGETIIKDMVKRQQYKELLSSARKNIEICSIATDEIAHVAAKLAISSMKHTAEIIESKVLHYISVAVAWGVDLMRRLTDGAEFAILMEGTEIVIHRTKEAVGLMMNEIEDIMPAVLKDSEWKEMKQAIIIQSIFGKHTIYDEEEIEENFVSRFSELIEVFKEKFISFTERIHTLSNGIQ